MALILGPLFLVLSYDSHQERMKMLREGVEANARILERNEKSGGGKRRHMRYSFDVIFERKDGETQRAVLSVSRDEFFASSPIRIRYLPSNPLHIVPANQRVDRPEFYAIGGLITLLGLIGGYVYWWPRKTSSGT